MANHPTLDVCVRAGVAAALKLRWPTSRPSFIVQDLPGWACLDGDPAAAVEEVAAAVAMAKASCAWDETNPMVIELASASLEVHLAVEGQDWAARVTRVGAEDGR